MLFGNTQPRPAPRDDARERNRRRRGHAAVEVSLLAPWILLLFAGLFDFGVYATSLITVENAARAAALITSQSYDAAIEPELACGVVRFHTKALSNVKNLTGPCGSLPLMVAQTAFQDSENFWVTRVAVTYQTPQLFTLPFMTGRLTMTRQAEMRVKP
jgi:uncharacterized iron-regulated membrane protein